MNTILIVTLIYLILCVLSFGIIKSFVKFVKNTGLVDDNDESTKAVYSVVNKGDKLFVILSPIILTAITISVIAALIVKKRV